MRRPFWNNLFLLASAFLLSGLSLQAQTLDEILAGTEEEDSSAYVDSSALVVANVAKVVANGEEWALDQPEFVVEPGKLYDVKISQVAPFSTIFIEAYKAGIKLGTRRFLTNQAGEYLFEYTVPEKKVKGIAKVKYRASDGTWNEHEFKFRIEKP